LTADSVRRIQWDIAPAIRVGKSSYPKVCVESHGTERQPVRGTVASKSLDLLEPSAGIEPAYTDLQAGVSRS